MKVHHPALTPAEPWARYLIDRIRVNTPRPANPWAALLAELARLADDEQTVGGVWAEPLAAAWLVRIAALAEQVTGVRSDPAHALLPPTADTESLLRLLLDGGADDGWAALADTAHACALFNIRAAGLAQ